MDSMTNARREAGLELQKLVQEFEQSDQAAFRRSRILCWIVLAVVTVVVLVLLLAGGDWRYLAAFWAIIVSLTAAGYWLSTRRQREQTDRLRALAIRWLADKPPE
ncbi:MAG TPA: hypothetical protein VD978_33305 [Azospirillum sp.]|nr:hypothetical protein [Azospirillum sp.]